MSYRDLPPVGDLPFAFSLMKDPAIPEGTERAEMLRLVWLYSEARAQLGTCEAQLAEAVGPNWRRLLGLAVRAVMAQQRGQYVNYYGTEVQIRAPKDQGMEAADLWCALDEAGLGDVTALMAGLDTPPPDDAPKVGDPK